MRLKKLRVSGFKSFVDTTDIRLPSTLCGIVGPNGCGKSNVIDAVRWVMGEASAKMLRGDNMADVIFNGSSARKPVGKASVELVFDNSDGKARGSYGQFAEIAVKRTLTRDGQSVYSINNIKTRRRDVLDLFRGTGLGPRSYSIIEQGMVSRIVEAKPEDLRLFVEEAAGTSRYKERRRETANRIMRTRENLQRVADIREELARQLRRLKRQSAAARQYQRLKEQERSVNGQLHVLKLRQLDDSLAEQDRLTASRHNTLEQALGGQRATENQLEELRAQQAEFNEQVARVQQALFENRAEIAKIEQQLEHAAEARLRQGEEITRLQADHAQRGEMLQEQVHAKKRLEACLAQLQPQIEALSETCTKAEQRLHSSEQILHDWMAELEQCNEKYRQPAQQVEVQRSRINYLQQHIERANSRQAEITDQIAAAQRQVNESGLHDLQQEVSRHDRKLAEAEQRYEATQAAIEQLRLKVRDAHAQAAARHSELKEAESRLGSLREIQQATMLPDDHSITGWLAHAGMENAPRLVAALAVAAGWERAAERVLDGYLSALCTDTRPEQWLRGKPDFALTVIARYQAAAADQPVQSASGAVSLPTLASKIESGLKRVGPLLNGVYAAESLDQALTMQPHLHPGERIVTRDGSIIGANWVSIASQSRLETGVLVREEEINQLARRCRIIEDEITADQSGVAELESAYQTARQDAHEQREALAQTRSHATLLHNRHAREESRQNELKARTASLRQEAEQLASQSLADRDEMANADLLMATARKTSGELKRRRERLLARKPGLTDDVAEARSHLTRHREALHEKNIEQQKLATEIRNTAANISRFADELEQAAKLLARLEQGDGHDEREAQALKRRLESLYHTRLSVDREYSESQSRSEQFEHRIETLSGKRKDEIQQVADCREELERQKLARQEIAVRKEALLESIREQNIDLQESTEALETDAAVAERQELLAQTEMKIARIGPVNLVAIEEFDEASERMQYLDGQYADLSEALTTLEDVIRKIDRETRSRFKETFDRINAGFNEFFPKLFGGGRAQLLLAGDDLLTTGITVMARPPGKRNSHIHLLSGGEKALTAVALIFALFELHPAPFCMLDEVDAPLDDANVDRYCETLQRLADKTQIVVVTHNKITMENMHLLVGVTMAEAGVSRLVSVNIDQAVAMAAQ